MLNNTTVQISAAVWCMRHLSHMGKCQPSTLAELPQGQAIWVSWHQNIFIIPRIFQLTPQVNAPRLVTINHHHGRMLGYSYLKLTGEQPIYLPVERHEQKARAGRTLIAAAIQNGSSVLIFWDGPNGPRYHAKPGAIEIGLDTGLPVLAIDVVAYRSFYLWRWDKAVIPTPFSKILYSVSHITTQQGGLT